MPLVADYSDSESEYGSDNEKIEDSSKPDSRVEGPIQNNKQGVTEAIEGEDDWESERTITGTGNASEATGNKLFSKLPEPSVSKINISEETEDEFVKKKPLTEDALYLKEKALLEQEKKKNVKKLQETTKRSLLSLPKPKGNKGKKQTVKISIPTLSEIGADSDSDEEILKQTPNVSANENKKASALFSLLPKPRHSVTVGANKNKVFEKQTNRLLMPHTLTKKRDVPAASAPKNSVNKIHSTTTVEKTRTSIVNEESDDDDDDDVSAENFFSLGNAEPENGNTIIETKDILNQIPPTELSQPTMGTKLLTKVPSVQSSVKTSQASSNTKGNDFFANLFNKKNATQSSGSKEQNIIVNKQNVKIDKNDSKKNADQNTVTAPFGNVTRPYGENIVSEVTRPYVSSTYSAVTKPYVDNNVTRPYGGNNVTRPYGDNNTYSAVTRPYGDNSGGSVTAPYNSVSAAGYGNQDQHQPNSYSYPTQPPQQQQQNFFAYEHQTGSSSQGASVDYYSQPNQDTPIDREALTALQGRKRRKEEINLIDINADDLCGGNDDYLKNLTKESGYQAKKPKKDQLSSTDKRKHQITYLAFQAKEREFELRQSWADSRASKQQTQSRYGF